MSSEPSSPMDPQQPLRQELGRLKEQYKTLESDFAYYEDSNGKLQQQVDKQAAEIEQKDLELTYLKELIERRAAEQDTTYEEVQNLRRRSSVLEKKIKSQGAELKNTVEAEKLLVDREAEVRHFTTELHQVKTDRDDKLAEVKGLEGDLERQILALEAKDFEIDSLHERIDVFERHIRITKDLPLEELDECLYDFVEKVVAKEGDVVAFSAKKEKRKSLTRGGGFNLADEFDALSDDDDDDEEYESGDDEGSDTRSVLSDVSVRSRKKKAKQVLGMSALQSVEMHPLINKPTMTSTGTQMSPISPKTIKPLAQMTSSETQTSPIKSPARPQTTSTETQTSPIAWPIKAQTTSTGTQYSPIASPVKFAAPSYASNETQTSPVASLIKAQTSSTGTQYSPIASPVNAHITSTGTQYSPITSPIKAQTSSTETQYSPIDSPVKSKYPGNPVASPVKTKITSTETQTSPVASPVKPRYATNETQTIPVASSPQKEDAQTSSSGVQTSPSSSPRRYIFEMISSADEMISSAVQTSPIVATIAKSTPGNASQETQTSPTVSSPKNATPETTSAAFQTSPDVTSLKESIFATNGTGAQTSPLSNSPEKAISEAPESKSLQPTSDANTQQQSSSQPQKAANSGVQPREKRASMQLSETRATSSGVGTSSNFASPPSSNLHTLNTKRPRVPAKDTIPPTLSPLKNATTLSTGEASSTTPILPNGSNPDLVTAPTFRQHAYLQPQAMFLYAIAGYVGYLIANALQERQWAEVNGYAPENGIIYIGRHLVTGLWGIFLAILAFFWHAVFGDWVSGGGYQRPLSPG